MPFAGLGWIALLTAIVSTANALHYGWTPAPRTSIDDALAWITAIAFALLYWLGIRTLKRSDRQYSLRELVVPVIPVVLIAFITIPYDSTDVFQYMSFGWAQAHYGLNPYTNVLRDIPDATSDPMISARWMTSNKNPWLDFPLVYGFAVSHLSKAIAVLGFGNWWLTLALFKLVNLACFVATVVLIDRAAKGFGLKRPDVATYLFLWSPLILQHHIANAHNDLLMGFLTVAALVLLAGQAAVWSPAVLMVSAFVKYATLPLVPLSVLFIAKTRGWKQAVVGSVIASVIGVAMSFPYVTEVQRFRFDLMRAQLDKVTAGSLYAFVFYLYRWLSGADSPLTWLKVLLWGVALVWILWETWSFWSKPQPEVRDIARLCCVVLVAIILVGSSQFYSWYLGMILPIALLVERDGVSDFVVTLGGTHVLSLTSLSRKGIGYFVLTTGVAGLIRKMKMGAGSSRHP